MQSVPMCFWLAAVTICAWAVQPTPPVPPSPIIAGIDWASANTIVRRAEGGDNWPVTWADDAIYTTWGDGTGFAPKVERKLSLGFARVSGSPADFVGANIRSPAEQLGANNGAAMQLAWSTDHAQTWTFADWRFEEFGLIGFVNYIQDYNAARDE